MLYVVVDDRFYMFVYAYYVDKYYYHRNLYSLRDVYCVHKFHHPHTVHK